MYLDYLKITSEIDNDQILIRYVKFQSGLNLISDITDIKNKTTTGNNIGKSTLLELIDICLGANDIDKIYSDKKTNGINKKVKEFLDNKKVFVELSININDSENINIKRSLYNNGKEIYFNHLKIDKLKDLKSLLNKYIFTNKFDKPSLRDLIPFFLRKEEDALKPPLDIFMDKTDNEKKYQILVFLFGWSNIELLSKLHNLKMKDKKLKNDLKVLKKRLDDPNKIETLLKTINESIEEYKKQLKNLNFSDNLMEALNKKNTIDISFINLQNKKLNLEYNINKHKESLESLENNISQITREELKFLYKESKYYLSNLNKDFEKLIQFHNEAISNEKKFIENNLNKLTKELLEINKELEKIISEKIEIETINDILNIENKINELEVQKGKYLNEQEKWKTIDKESVEIKKEKEKIEDSIKESEKELKNNLDFFNTIYKENQLSLNTNRLDLLVISYDEKKGVDIISTDGKKGTGAKMKDTLVFNISYAQFLNKCNINFPTFFIFDCSELIHENTREIIFSELVNKNNIQLILPVLTSSLPEDIKNKINEYSILRLSENEKLFKIEIIEKIYPMIAEGISFAKEYDYANAKSKFEEVLLIDPNRDDVNYYLGLIYLNDHHNFNEKKAKEYFKKALDINPHNYRALKDLGTYIMANYSIDEGIEYIFDSIKIKPDYKEAYDKLEEIYYKINNSSDEQFKNKYKYILSKIYLLTDIGDKIEINLDIKEYKLNDEIIDTKSIPEYDFAIV